MMNYLPIWIQVTQQFICNNLENMSKLGKWILHDLTEANMNILQEYKSMQRVKANRLKYKFKWTFFQENFW